MLKLTMLEKLFYVVPYVALIAITIDGRLYVIADAAVVVFVLITALLLASSAVGYFAEKKGRNRISFFLLSFFLSPILMGLLVAVISGSNTSNQKNS